MPTYQYACTNPEGKHEFEVVQSFSDSPVSECPECGVPVRKVYGSVGVVFKGSGFYRTDSRNGGNGDGSGSAEKGGAGEKSKSNGESKPGSAEPAAPKVNGSTGGKQPVGSGASSTGGSSSS